MTLTRKAFADLRQASVMLLYQQGESQTVVKQGGLTVDAA